MKSNIGKRDKMIRFILGGIIIILGIIMKNAWGLTGLIPVITVLISWCPLYWISGKIKSD
jgi:hypothetical protein